MNRRSLLGGLAAAALAPRASGAARRPNLLLIYIDDLGYGDLGCYGGRLVATPRLDALAAEGVRCAAGYVTAPICAPSRAGLLAGAYQQRFGIENNEDQWPRAQPLQQWGEHRLLPDILRAAGYRTGLIGKWNLARQPRDVFDEAVAVMDWKGDYFPDAEGRYAGVDGAPAAEERHDWFDDGPGGEYLTDRLSRLAGEFIDRHRSRPFFLYLAYNAVHSPWQAPRRWREKLGDLTDPLRLYAAMLGNLDENIGRVLDALRAAGLERETLVACISDNGHALGRRGMGDWREDWPAELPMGSAGELAGHKAGLQEGGIRVPYLLRWPGRLPAGQVVETPVSTLDILPTFCAAAGVAPPEQRVEGIDLRPLLTGETPPPSRLLFWKQNESLAVRDERYKLFKWPKQTEPVLFDLLADPGETRNVAGRQPEVAARLKTAWEQWRASLPATATARWQATRP